jgi:hypothetical protein
MTRTPCRRHRIGVSLLIGDPFLNLITNEAQPVSR